MTWKVSHESKDHFHVQGNVGIFKVAKANLHPKMVETMRLACGGKVQKFDDGGKVEEPTSNGKSPLVSENMWAKANQDLDVTPAPSSGETPPLVSEEMWNKAEQDLGVAPKTEQGTTDALQKSLTAAPESVTPNQPLPTSSDVDFFKRQALSDDWLTPDAKARMLAMQAQSSAGGASAENQKTPASESTPAPPSATTPSAQTQASATAAASTPTSGPMASSPGDGGALRAAKATAKEQEKLGTIEQQNAQKIADQKMAAAQQDKQWINLHEQARTQGRAALDKMFEDYKNSKIDPEHFWADKSGFDRVRMGIGMLISGIGSGLTGQPNLAIQYINNAIGRDMDAQRANLGKKATLIGFYRDQMKDDQAGDLMAHAAILNNVAAEMDAQATRLGGSAEAQKLKILASQTRQAGLAESDQAALRKVQVQKAQLDLQVERQTMALRQKIISTGLGNLTQQEMSAAGMLGLVEPVQIDRNGTLGVARSKQDAEKLNAALPEWHAVQDVIERMQQIKNKEGKYASMPLTDAKNEYDGLQYNLGNAIEKATAGRVNNETLEGQIVNMGGAWARLYHKDNLAATREWANAQHRALVTQHTWSREGGSVAGFEMPRTQGSAIPQGSGIPPGAILVTNGSRNALLPPGTAMPSGWRRAN